MPLPPSIMYAPISFYALIAAWAAWATWATDYVAAAAPASACPLNQPGSSVICGAEHGTRTGLPSPAWKDKVTDEQYRESEPASKIVKRYNTAKTRQIVAPLFALGKNKRLAVETHVGSYRDIKPLRLLFDLKFRSTWGQSNDQPEGQKFPELGYYDCSGYKQGTRWSLPVCSNPGIGTFNIREMSTCLATGYDYLDFIGIQGLYSADRLVFKAASDVPLDHVLATEADGMIGFPPVIPNPSQETTTWFGSVMKQLSRPIFVIMLSQDDPVAQGTLRVGHIDTKECIGPASNARLVSQDSWTVSVVGHAIGDFNTRGEYEEDVEITMEFPFITTRSMVVDRVYRDVPGAVSTPDHGIIFPCISEKYLSDFQVWLHYSGEEEALVIPRESFIVDRFKRPKIDTQTWCKGLVQNEDLFGGRKYIGYGAFYTSCVQFQERLPKSNSEGVRSVTFFRKADSWEKIEKDRRKTAQMNQLKAEIRAELKGLATMTKEVEEQRNKDTGYSYLKLYRQEQSNVRKQK